MTATDTDAAALARAVELTEAIAASRVNTDRLVRERDIEWARLYDDGRGVPQRTIAAACGMTADAIYQGIRRAAGRPVPRGK